MIFVTVGSMVPFDRMIESMDLWAKANRSEEVFAQIGAGQYVPHHMKHERMLSVGEYKKLALTCSLIVAHAGMGSFITAAEIGKPIVLFPRRHSLGEHNTDHQLDTVKWLTGRPGVYVATNADELTHQISIARRDRETGTALPTRAPASFVGKLREAIVSNRPSV